MAQTKTLLQVSGLTLRFEQWGQEVTALNNLSISVFAGEWVMLVGHNGSGKSSLLKSVAGWEKPQQGTISLMGRELDTWSVPQMADELFFLHQTPSQNCCYKMDLLSNLMVAAEVNGARNASRRDIREKCERILKDRSLYDRRNQHPNTLSGGERQLFALLNVEVHPRKLLLLDEPTSQLDQANAARCLAEIKRLHERGMTVIQVTHDLRMAVEFGQRTVGMASGEIVYDSLGEQRQIPDLETVLRGRQLSEI